MHYLIGYLLIFALVLMLIWPLCVAAKRGDQCIERELQRSNTP